MQAGELRMSKKLTLNFSNYMVLTILGSLVFSGCVKFSSSHSRPTTEVEKKQGPMPEQPQRPQSESIQEKSQGPTPEEIVKDPERFGKYVSWRNSCEVLKVQFNEETMQAENVLQNLTIERQYQRIVRKNCAGEVVSDQVETVSPPTRNFDLKIPGSASVQSFFVYNDETCAHKLATMKATDGAWNVLFPVTSGRKNSLRISGDMADAELTFHMREGLNNIYVKYFYDCSPEDVIGNIHINIGRSNCREAKDSLIVQYPVFVTYNKRTLNEVMNIQPTPQECAAQNQNP
jgi:hypothetical protein